MSVDAAEPTSWSSVVTWQFTVPRIVLATMVGSGIGAAGWTIQRVTRNPLAQPSVLGVPAAAAAAVLLLLWHAEGTVLSTLAIPAAAFGGGMFATAMLFVCTGVRVPWNGTRILLVGTALGALCTAAMFAIALCAEPATSAYALGWLAGSLGSTSWTHVDALYSPWAVLSTTLLLLTPRLLALGFDDDTAGSLGLRVPIDRRAAFALAALLVAACTAFGGALGLLGFAAPHLARVIGGGGANRPDAAAVTGALLLLGSDALGRVLSPGVEIPAGIVVVVACVPWFAFLMLRPTPWQSN